MNIHSLGNMIGGQNRQDGVIYNGYLFRFEASGNCNVYKMEDLLNSSSAEIKPISSFILDKSDIIKPHSNSVAFGNEYFEKGDEFPLLYSNIYNNYAASTNRLEGVTCVYRLIKNEAGFSTKLVQLIEIGFTDDPIWKSQNIKDFRPYGNFAIDTDNSVYYAFTMRDEDRITRYFSFSLPKVTDGILDERFGVNRAVLNKEDIKTYFDCEYHRCIQGACYHKGFIYSTEGFTNDETNPPAIRIIDIKNQKQKEMYLLTDYGATIEPEMIDFENDICYYSDDKGNFYKLTF